MNETKQIVVRLCEIDMDYMLEAIDFGPRLGQLSLLQYKNAIFHERCLTKNSDDSDSTGLRLHGGAHIAIRFLLAVDIGLHSGR